MKIQDWDYNEFKSNFHLKTGLDLNSYKDRQMERRIRQMIQREKRGGFRDFFILLNEDPSAMHSFLSYLTINTSGFFRDAAVYDNLKNIVFPQLLSGFDRLRIWSAGCASGEEPYTLAIILNHMSVLQKCRVLSSDIDEKALEKARAGCYSRRQMENVPPPVVRNCFIREGENFFILDKFKKAVTFYRVNLLESIPETFQNVHLILCRNVFIYLKAEAQEKIINGFCRCLQPGGFFIIGCAEYIGNPSGFGLERKYPSVYQKVK